MELSDLWKVIISQGPMAALLFFILYVVNNERQAYRTKTDQLNEEIRERLLKALNDTTVALKELRDIMTRMAGGK